MQRTVMLLILFLNVTLTFSQTYNQQVLDENSQPMLLGKMNKKDLTKAPFNEWFTKKHEAYLVNTKIIAAIKDSLKNCTIKVFLGTWCGDSQREVPRFYSVLEAAHFPMKNLEVFGLDHSDTAYKQGPNGEEKGMNIHRVPTFIFYKDGKEINRIVESPKETLERDIRKIVTGERYNFNYLAAHYIHYLLKETSIIEMKNDEKTLVPRLAEFVEGSGELNTLGYVYLRSQQLEKAQYVFELNTKIFPYKHNVYDSFAEYYFETKNNTKAFSNYYKVLSLKTDDTNAMEMIEKIKGFRRKVNK